MWTEEGAGYKQNRGPFFSHRFPLLAESYGVLQKVPRLRGDILIILFPESIPTGSRKASDLDKAAWFTFLPPVTLFVPLILGVLATQTRHDYCPQSSMIRGVMSPGLVGRW